MTDLLAWGNDGQLEDQPDFQPKSRNYGINVTDISCGKRHSALITHNAQLFILQYASINLINIPIKVKQASCGFEHTLCVGVQGEVFSWGDNTYGQLGLGDQVKSIQTPVQVMYGTSVDCGNYHSVILSKQGEPYSFGLGE